jgi:hypothetical protein
MRRFGSLWRLKLNPQELPLYWSRHCTLGLTYLELEPSREEARDTRHHPLPRSLAAYVDTAVVQQISLYNSSPFSSFHPYARRSWQRCVKTLGFSTFVF